MAAMQRCPFQHAARWPGSGRAAGVALRSVREAREARLWGRDERAASPRSSSSKPPQPGGPGKGDGDDGDDDESTGWGLFSLQRYGARWDVPWGPGRVAGGLALWFASFLGVGFLLVPQLYRLAGLTVYELPPEGKASFTFVCQVVETVVTLALVRGLTAADIERTGTRGLFDYSPAGPFAAPRGWAAWGLLGIALSPVVVGSVAALLSATGYEEGVGGQGTVDGVATMIELDLPTYVYLLAVTGVLAPVLEETVFRGFLLTSLTKFMPTWAAVVASSVAFGLAHLSARDLPVLSGLGMLLGFSYVRSRNLLTPILIHGAWNSGVLSLLFYLAAQGVDVQELLGELRKAAG